jgi:hypothetical protein
MHIRTYGLITTAQVFTDRGCQNLTANINSGIPHYTTALGPLVDRLENYNMQRTSEYAIATRKY